jgi:chromosome partitioning protein
LLKGYHSFDGELAAKDAGEARAKVEVAAEEALAAEASAAIPSPAQAPPQPQSAPKLDPRALPVGHRSFNMWRAFDSRLNAVDGTAEAVVQRRPLLETTTAVFPVSGGVGATTIAATLACMIAIQERRVLVVDGDTDPILSVYLGDTPAYGSAMSSEGLGNGGTIHVLSREDGETEASWLQRGWQRMEGRFDQALIDVWPGASVETFSHAVRANRLLLVMTPDMGSILRLPRVLARIRTAAPEGKHQPPYFLLNKFDASLELHREVRQRLADRFGEQLLPFEIRRSDEPAEALASGTTLMEFAPQAGITQDLFSLAQWMSLPAAGREIDRETGLAR